MLCHTIIFISISLQASAHFHNAAPHEYLADLVDHKRDGITLPIPILTLTNKSIHTHTPSAIQSVYVYPVKYTDMDMCMEKLREVGRSVCKDKKSKGVYDAYGGVCMEGTSLEEYVGVSLCMHVYVGMGTGMEVFMGMDMGMI